MTDMLSPKNNGNPPRESTLKYLALAIAPIFLFTLVGFNKYSPPSEGWWITYGYLLKNNLVPFKDFYLPTAPFFVYLHYLFLEIFGDHYVYLRFIGILANAVTFGVMFSLLRLRYPLHIAAYSTIVASLLYVASPVFSAHDYHIVVDLLTICSIYFSFLAFRNLRLSSSIALFIFAGILVSMLFLTKQNVGIFVGLGIFLSIFIAYYPSRNAMMFAQLGFLLGALIFLIGFCMTLGISPWLVFENLVFTADSKGSPETVLLRFLRDPYSRYLIKTGVVIAVIAYIVKDSYPFRLLRNSSFLGKCISETPKHKRRIAVMLFLAFFISHIFRFYNDPGNRQLVFDWIIISTISYLVLGLIRLVWEKTDKELVFYFIPLLLLVYTNTQTAAPAVWGIPLAIGLALCGFLSLIDRVVIFRKAVYFAIAPFLIVIILYKIIAPYSWWGSTQSDIRIANYELPYSQLHGIYVDEPTWQIYNRIKMAIDSYSTEKKDVYLYPNIPLFYYLHGKYPPSQSIGQWFDFISSRQMEHEIDHFFGHLPKLIVMFDPPPLVYDAHEKMIDRPLLQRKFRSQVESLVKEGIYEPIDVFFYTERVLKDYPKKQEKVWARFDVINPNNVNKNVLALLSPLNVTASKIIRGFVDVPVDKETTFHIGDIIELNIPLEVLNRVSLLLGPLRNQHETDSSGVLRSYYVLKIYKKIVHCERRDC